MPKKRFNWFRTCHDLLDNPEFKKIPASAVKLLWYLLKLHNRFTPDNENDCPFFRKIENLEIDTGMNKKTIIRAKKILVEKGFISIKRGDLEKSPKGTKRTADVFCIEGIKYFEEDEF